MHDAAALINARIRERGNRYSRFRAVVGAAMALGAVLWASGSAVCLAGPPLANVVDNVYANEQLFESIGLACRVDYKHLGEPYEATFQGLKARLTLDQDDRVRYVRQKGRFRIDVTRDYTAYEVDGPQHYERVRMFDLQKTRTRINDDLVNIAEGAVPDKLNLRPHMLLLSDVDYPVALSTYLRGRRAVEEAPGVKWDDGHEFEVTALGPEPTGGYTCQKLSIVHTLNGRRIFGTVLLLAVERNYIPVKMETYTYMWSKDTPIGDARIEAFAEVEPGIWFPTDATITCYDAPTLGSQGQQKPVWRRKMHFEDLTLHPGRPDEFFSDLDIPHGAAVHEVADGKIVRSYRKGAPATANDRVLGKWWLLWLNLAMVCLAGAAVWLNRRRGATRARHRTP